MTWTGRIYRCRSPLRAAAIALCAMMLGACGEPANHSRAAFVLVDISGDYAGEMRKAQQVTNYLLGNLTTGDSMAIAFIDNSSYTERNLITQVDFDHRPSVTTGQKRQVRAELDGFLERFSVPSAHSDITGGILLARDILDATDAGERYLFILSDLQEDLPPWLNRDGPLELDGIRVVALNVTRQRDDNHNPQAYRGRLAAWQQRVEASGGEWQVVNELARLDNTVAMR